MFELNVGSTPCDLTLHDYRELAQLTDGYSGSDVAVLVRDALMQPVRKVLSATHFKVVPAEDNQRRLTPCSPGDEGAMEMTWADVDSNELVEPRLVKSDFLKAIQAVRPSVTRGDSASAFADQSTSTPSLRARLASSNVAILSYSLSSSRAVSNNTPRSRERRDALYTITRLARTWSSARDASALVSRYALLHATDKRGTFLC